MTLFRRTVFCLALLWASSPAWAADPTLAGHWEGVIEVPGNTLKLNLDFTLTHEGWQGDISIPAQGARDMPLEGISLEGRKATFAMAGVPGNPTFTGTLSETGNVLAGDFLQGGQTFPFRLVATRDATARVAAALKSLDGIINPALEDWKTPGLALGVVAGGKVALVAGYGLRDVAQTLPVTPDTLFAIGSASKAFTTFLLGTLVDEGLLQWDEPVRTYLHDFQLDDEYASAHLNTRDMTSHRSGLPRHDLTWYNNESITRAELVHNLRYLPANKELRETFQYNNLMFLTAGYLIEQLTGQTWEESVRKRIFDPLGMDRSNFDVAVSQLDSDHALPYVQRGDELQKVDFRPITVMAPAGAINSSVREMTRWLLVQLAEGTLDGEKLIDAGTLRETHVPQMVVPGLSRESEKSALNYGMGWFIDTWRGHLRVHHGGHIDGFSALVTLYPRDDVGVVVLVNKNGSALTDLITDTVADRALELEPRDWIVAAARKRDVAREFADTGKDARARFRVEKTRPSRPLADFAGEYRHPGYGVLEIRLAADSLTMDFNDMTMPLEHWHYDTFNVAETEEAIIPENLRVSFITDQRGRVSRLEAPLEPLVDPLVFTREPDARMADPAFLARLAGRYRVPGQIISVRVQGTVLVMQAGGQPALELVPSGDLEFDLKAVTGFSARFTLPAEGPATELILVQPNGVFTATRAVDTDEEQDDS